MFPVVRAASVFVGVGVFLSLPLLSPAKADIRAFPPDFRTEDVKAGDAVIHVRVGGHGPAIVMLHGFGDSGDMWAPLAAEMAKDHTVVVPDLRGMGLSSHPAGGYDKKTQANDVAAVLDKLGIRRADLVTHDIGNMVGYAFAAQFADRVTRWVAMDAPLPGIGNWDKIVLRTSATTSESPGVRAPCGDVTRGSGILDVAIRQYAGRHDRQASDSVQMGVRRLKAR